MGHSNTYQLYQINVKASRSFIILKVLHDVLSKEVRKQNYKLLMKMNPASNYMFKVNNRNNRTKCEIYSKITIKTPVPLLLTLNIFHTLI